jgi:hypothetical protein
MKPIIGLTQNPHRTIVHLAGPGDKVYSLNHLLIRAIGKDGILRDKREAVHQILDGVITADNVESTMNLISKSRGETDISAMNYGPDLAVVFAADRSTNKHIENPIAEQVFRKTKSTELP